MLMAAGAEAQYVRLGDGNFLGTAGGPFTSNATTAVAYSRFATIYPKSVLGNMKHGDTIESIEFMRAAGASLNTNCQLTIWLKNTTKTDFGSGKLYFPGEVTGATRIYDQNPSLEIGTAEGFHRIPCFNRKFVYDSTQGENLELLVQYSQTAVQPIRINWYFEIGVTFPGYTANQTKSFAGTALIDSLATSSDFHPVIIFNYPRLDFDAAVLKFYTLGKLPVPLGNPDSTKVLLRNVGKKDISGGKMFTWLRGANNSGRDSMSYNLTRGSEAFFNMPSLAPTAKGLDTVLAAAADKNADNNAGLSFRFNNENKYSYRDVTQSPGPGGIGFNGTNGDFVARFYSNKSKAINQVSVAFAQTGLPFRVGIWESKTGGLPGKLIYQSDSLTTVAGTYILDLKKAVSVNGSFFVGVRQLGVNNVAFGYQEEFPVRPRTFFYAEPLGDTNWVDFAPGAPFKFIIEPRLQGDTDLLAVSADFPRDSIDRYTMDTMAPRGTIGNIGVKDLKDSFDVICEITVFGRRVYREVIRDTLSAGLRRSYTFPKRFYPTDFGEHEVRIIVSKKGDLINDNDTARRKFFVGVKKDVMVSGVFDPIPENVYEYLRDTIMPTATIQNVGYDNSITFFSRCRILKGNTVVYNQTRSLALPRFQSRIMTWPTYRCTDTGKLTFIITTEMSGDKFRQNDTQRATVYVLKSYDLGIDSIASPQANRFYDPGKPISLRARVYNDGLLGVGSGLLTVSISTAYGTQRHRDTMKVVMAGKDGYIMSLPKTFTPQRKGLYRAVFRVIEANDLVRQNDSMVVNFYVGKPFDYAALNIYYPTPSDTLSIGNGPFAPQVRIGNLGFIKDPGLVPFICQVWYGTQRVYQDIKSTTLDTGQLLTIDMLKTLNPINDGIYRILLYTNYSSDVDRKNDSIWGSFTVVIGKDALVKYIDTPGSGTRWSARETAVPVRALIASKGRQPIGAVSTIATLYNAWNKVIYSSSRKDTFTAAKEDKWAVLPSFILPDSGIYRLIVRTSSLLDQNIFNDTQQVWIQGYRRVDVVPTTFEVPLAGQWVVNTSGSRPLAVRIAQLGEDTGSVAAGYGAFEIRDSVAGNLLFADTGYYGGLKRPVSQLLSGSRNYPFAIAGVFKAAFHLRGGTDLFPENDSISTSFRVIFNGLKPLAESRVRLYPNPGAGEFILSADIPVQSVRVTDVRGREAAVQPSGEGRYLIGSLPPGIYMLRVQTAEGVITLPWVRSDR